MRRRTSVGVRIESLEPRVLLSSQRLLQAVPALVAHETIGGRTNLPEASVPGPDPQLLPSKWESGSAGPAAVCSETPSPIAASDNAQATTAEILSRDGLADGASSVSDNAQVEAGPLELPSQQVDADRDISFDGSGTSASGEIPLASDSATPETDSPFSPVSLAEPAPPVLEPPLSVNEPAPQQDEPSSPVTDALSPPVLPPTDLTSPSTEPAPSVPEPPAVADEPAPPPDSPSAPVSDLASSPEQPALPEAQPPLAENDPPSSEPINETKDETMTAGAAGDEPVLPGAVVLVDRPIPGNEPDGQRLTNPDGPTDPRGPTNIAKDGSDELASELVGPESVRRVDRNDPENDSGGEKDEADDESDANDTVDTETDESAKSQDQVDDGPSDREIAATTPNIQTTSSQDPAPVEPLDDPALWNSVEEELFLPSETGGSSESPQDGGDFVLSGRQGSGSSLAESGQSDQSTTPPTSQDDVPLTLNPVCATFSAGLVILSLSRPFHPSPPLPGLDEPTDDDSGAFRSRSQRRLPRGLRRRKTDARPASRQKPTQSATADTTAEGSQPDHAKELIDSEFARRAVLTLVNLARTENSDDSDFRDPSWLEDRLSQMAIGAAAVAATTGWLASRHQRSPSQSKTVLRLNPASMYTGPTVGLTEPGY